MHVDVKHGVQSKQQVPYMMLLGDDDIKHSLVGHAQVKGKRDEGSTFCCCLC